MSNFDNMLAWTFTSECSIPDDVIEILANWHNL